MLDVIQGLGILVLVHFGFMPQYPLAVFEWFRGQPWEGLAWLTIGALGLLAFRKIRRRQFLKPFVAVWFMPGVMVCGAAGLWPWPVTLFDAFGPGMCSGPFTAATCLGLNLMSIYGLAAAWRWFRRRRSTGIQSS
jgi:hypothetical protein